MGDINEFHKIDKIYGKFNFLPKTALDANKTGLIRMSKTQGAEFYQCRRQKSQVSPSERKMGQPITGGTPRRSIPSIFVESHPLLAQPNLEK